MAATPRVDADAVQGVATLYNHSTLMARCQSLFLSHPVQVVEEATEGEGMDVESLEQEDQARLLVASNKIY